MAPKKSDDTESESSVGIHWFRNCLRLHDNPCLLEACRASERLVPIYVIDPEAPFAQTEGLGAGAIRASFVLESISELQKKLKNLGSDLIVVRGNAAEVLPDVIEATGAGALYYEREPAEPVRKADARVLEAIQNAKGNCDIKGFDTHTLHPVEEYVARCKDGAAPASYGGFLKIFDKCGQVAKECDSVSKIPGLPEMDEFEKRYSGKTGVPSLADLGYNKDETTGRNKAGLDFKGGEDAGLDLLKMMMGRTKWVCTFEKPKTSPNALKVDTTGLSPYIKHGCVSPRKFYHELAKVYAKHNPKNCSKPPVSLHGQLLWREYNYLTGYTTPNFDKMEGNPVARQIPWDDDPRLLEAWEASQTGYPFIDAIMTQLRETGWIHHLARHSVACFLTRGDLWQSWEKGAAVFEKHLIDADWSINNFNWQWLSCTAHFYQYFRVYSPVAFGKKTDPNGDYIRKWLPQFKNFPKKYIYEPWDAPLDVQKKYGVVIGKDYPHPIVDHKVASNDNKQRMKEAYDEHKAEQNSSSANSSSNNSRKRKAAN